MCEVLSGGKMEQEMKGFWKYFILLMAGAVINLAGALIGKTIVGYVLFGLGLAAVIAIFVFAFIKKSFFKGENRKFLILGLVLGIFLAASATLLITSSSSTAGGMTPPAGFSAPTGGQNSAMPSGTNSTTGTMPQGGPSGNSGSGPTSGTGNGNGAGTGNSMRTGNSASTGMPGAMTGNRGTSASSGVIKIIAWVLLGLGAALLIFVVVRLLTKKTSLKGDHWKVALLGLLIGAILASSTALLLTKSSNAGFSQAGMSGQLPGTQQAGAAVSATETATETETVTPTTVPTSTPKPTATATTVVTASMVVCLDYDVQLGVNIHNFPSADSKNIGSIPAAGCFTVDGKNSSYAGWYHMADGQEGYGGITIWTKADANGMWVNDKNFDKTTEQLSTLPEVAVTATK
jgi:hypothetical protein